MRGAIQYFLFSGTAWFAAGLLFALLIFLDLSGKPERQRLIASAARIGLALAMVVGAFSGTPLPWWLAAPLFVATIIYVAFFFGRTNIPVAILTLLLVFVALAYEGCYFIAKPIDVGTPREIVVIGDSISSGGFGEPAAWPELLARSTGIPVRNLAQPAETAASALIYQLPKLEAHSLVILEIGGNDLLGGTSARAFAQALEKLVAEVRKGGRRVVMFELPLLPGKWSFGSAQRRIARRHGVSLIPKRVLAGLLTDPKNVGDDALHLTAQGHQRLADEVRRWLKLEGTRDLAARALTRSEAVRDPRIEEGPVHSEG